MPYQKTKEGRLVNEITLGDGYPLSNDKQPLKVGGEASIINVSSPTPDGSVDGEVEVKGNFKAKDTAIEGNFSATSIENVPQFNFHSRNNISARLDVQASANQTASIRIKNNQGYFDIKRLYSSTSLQFTDGTNTPLILDGNNVQFTNLTDGSITIDSFVDEDDMSSNSATKIPTQQSVKAYVDNEVAGLVDSAPAALDTLNELAAALNDDASFSTTVTNSLALKAPLAAPAFTGTATAVNLEISEDLMLRGEGGIFIENSATANGGSIIQPAGGMYRTSTNAHTGAIKITVPRGTGNPTDMISFWVDVFDYGTNQAFTAYIAGYVYQDEGSNEWHNVSAQIFGNLEQNNYTIRFGHDTNNHCVLIGETTTSWNYMQVTVRNVQVGYSADIDDYKGDWTITFETSLPTIDETLSNNFTLAKGLKSSGSIAVTTGTSAGNNFTINSTGLVFEGDTNRLGLGTVSPASTFHVEEGDIRIDTASGGTQALRFSETNTTKAQVQYRSGDEEFNLITVDASGTAQKRMTIKSEQDATSVGIGTTSPTTTLDVEGTVSYKHTSLSADSDDLDVSGVTVVECTPSGTDRLGGLTGGVQGQILYILKVDSGLGRVIIEHNEGTGNQDIFLSGGSDVMLSSRGGMTLYCNGTSWFALDK